MGYRLLGYVCIRKKKRWNTTAQVPSLLNGCSSMKGRRKEGGKNSWQSVCVSIPRLFIQSLIGLSFILLQPSVRTIKQGKAPSRLRVVMMMVVGQWDKGALCW